MEWLSWMGFWVVGFIAGCIFMHGWINTPFRRRPRPYLRTAYEQVRLGALLDAHGNSMVKMAIHQDISADELAELRALFNEFSLTPAARSQTAEVSE